MRSKESIKDWAAIHAAQKQLKDAKRALRSSLLKRDRRAARVDAALDAFRQSVRMVEVAQTDVQVAQRANDQAFVRAVDRSLREGGNT